MSRESAMLSLRSASRLFPGAPPVHAVVGATLDIGRGDFVSIVGRSGSGKSTLLNLLALLDAPTDGTYLVGGVDTGTLTEAARAQLRAATFGFVFQQFHLLDRESVRVNVELGLRYRSVTRRARHGAVDRAIGRVGLTPRAGYRVAELSGGERQRVAVARAVVGGAPVLVADEPTGNLDSATAASIVVLLHELHQRGTTVVLVTHDETTARKAPRRYRMADGRLVELAGAPAGGTGA